MDVRIKLSLKTILPAFIALVTISGCNSGGGGSSDVSGNTGNESIVDSIVIEPNTVMLTQLGQQVTLRARAFNAAGKELNVPFAWTSSHPTKVGIDSDGSITAHSVGSAEIKVVANGVKSQSAIALMTLPVVDARMVTDEQIIGDPSPVDASAQYGLGFQYNVTMHGIEAPSVGEVVLATGEAPVGGRVVSVTEVGEDFVVTLEVISIPEMFDHLVLNETLDLKTASFSIPAAVSEYYDAQSSPDGSLLLTLKSEVQTNIKTAAVSNKIGVGSNPFYPFECEFTTGPFFKINALSPTISFDEDLSLPIIYNESTGKLEKLSVQGSIKVGFTVDSTFTSQVEGKGACTLEIKNITIPIGGPLARVFGGQVPVGIGFEVVSKSTFSGVGFKLSSDATVNMETGMVCLQGQSSCSMLNSFEATGKTMADWVFPDIFNPDAQFRFEPTLQGFGYTKLKFGSSFKYFSKLKMEAFEIKGGPKLGTNFANVDAQVLDESYTSDYKLSLDVEAGPSQDLDKLIGLIGVDLLKAQFKNSIPLTTSPKAESVTMDRGVFDLGDSVKFAVKLDPTSINFIPFVYNVDSIEIYRKISQYDIQKVATKKALDGQTEFSLEWEADDSGTSANSFFAFVVPRSLAIPYLGSLELGMPEDNNGLIDGKWESDCIPLGPVSIKIVKLFSAETATFSDSSNSYADSACQTLTQTTSVGGGAYQVGKEVTTMQGAQGYEHTMAPSILNGIQLYGSLVLDGTTLYLSNHSALDLSGDPYLVTGTPEDRVLLIDYEKAWYKQ